MVLGLLAGGLGLVDGLLKGNEKKDQAKHFNKQAAQLREEGLLDFASIHNALFGEEGVRDPSGGLYGKALMELLGVRPLLEQGYGNARQDIRRGMGKQAGQYREAIGDVRQGYDDANRQIDQVGYGSRNEIARNKEQGVKSGTARAARMGLLTTSADLERSGRGDAQSALARLGESLAQMRSGLAERQGQTIGGIRQGIGDIYGQGFGALAGLSEREGQALGAHQASLSDALLSRAQAYAQNQAAKANFRLGVPFQMNVPSSGSILGSSLVQGLSGGLGVAAQQGYFNPQQGGYHYPNTFVGAPTG